jgi:hypothetical protein
MALIEYEPWTPQGGTPNDEHADIIATATSICRGLRAAGYDITLRQLYYRFVATGKIPNTQQDYKRLGSILNRARMAGLFDWNYLIDRTRNLATMPHWGDPSDIIEASAQSFAVDKWSDQPRRVEIWVEKEALAGVIGRVAERWDCSWFACRGYVSQSEQWGAGRRFRRYLRAGQAVTVLHLGDHDPSGMDMTRDIEDRIKRFVTVDWAGYPVDADGVESVLDDIRDDLGLPGDEEPVEIRRIALNWDQIQRYNPPPNPAKFTDSRASGYVRQYGASSWELDALPPDVLDALIEHHIAGIVDAELYDARRGEENRHIDLLTRASRRWDELVTVLEGE